MKNDGPSLLRQALNGFNLMTETMEMDRGAMVARGRTAVRHDLDAILALIPSGVRALDLGCGDGFLMEQLVRQKQVQARGVELNEDNVRACIGRGLSVRQGNIEEGLADYSNGAFDFVILSQTLAFLDRPRTVVQEMLRVGQRVIISFENAGYWRLRWRSLTGGGYGSMLGSGEARVRAITIPQFVDFANSLGTTVDAAIFMKHKRRIGCLPNLRAEVAVFVLKGH